MSASESKTGGRDATGAIVPGRFALSIGRAALPEPSGFKWHSLSDLARLESGHTPSRSHPEYWDGVIPWVGIRDATANHGNIISDTNQHVSQLGLANSSARLLPAGTVCLSRTASVGYVVEMGVPMATSQDFVNWVCGPDLSPSYLRYLFVAEQESVRRFAYGTTHQTMYYPEAKALYVLAPERSEQDAIADVMRALDEKIMANATLIARAEELSQAMFKSALEDSVSMPLSETARFVNGKAFTKDASGTGRVVIRIAELNAGLGGSTVFSDAVVSDEHLARQGDILFAWSGSLTLHRWFRSEAIVNQHIFKVIPDGYPSWLVYQVLRERLAYFKGIAADKATTMGHIQRKHLDEFVGVPSKQAISRADGLMTPLWERTLAAELESESLAVTRSALLPQLISGKLRVKEAVAVAEAVL